MPLFSKNNPGDEILPIRTKIAYAIGDLGNAVGPGTIIPFWYTFFLTDIAKLNLGLVSLFWVIVTSWDAINNPLIGYLSDRTRTRWGRRRPYLLFGAVPFGAFFLLLWWIPPTHNQGLLFSYYLIIYILFETTASAVVCPHQALAPELTQDHDERTSLTMYRMGITIAAGVLVPVLFGLLLLPHFPDRDPRPYQILAVICGVCFAAAFLIAFTGTQERQHFQRKDYLPWRDVARFIFRNRSFHYTVAIYVFGWMAVSVVQALFAYYFIYWIGMGADEVSLVQGAIMLAAWLLLPAVLWLAQHFEKKIAYILGVSSWALILMLTLLLPQGARTAAYIICALSGFGIAAIHLLPSAMLPDIIEVDELHSGHRQEGAYSGVTIFAGKLGQMVILALLPVILQWSGYVQPNPGNPLPTQPASALLALRLMIAILPALLLSISMVVAWFYPITRARHAEIRQKLVLKNSK